MSGPRLDGRLMHGRLRVRVAHLLLVVLGLVAVVYALTLGGSAQIRCREVTMTPGSVCLKADGSEGQTYEQRLATRRSAQPVVAGVGLLVAGFGGILLVSDLRRRPVVGSAVEDAG